MLSTADYIKQQRNKSYTELIKERERILDSIQKYETEEMGKVKKDVSFPTSETMYQMQIRYLKSVCELMLEKL